jgi:hypothetical protein
MTSEICHLRSLQPIILLVAVTLLRSLLAHSPSKPSLIALIFWYYSIDSQIRLRASTESSTISICPNTTTKSKSIQTVVPVVILTRWNRRSAKAQDKILFTVSQKIGINTNNVAEYQAVLIPSGIQSKKYLPIN